MPNKRIWANGSNGRTPVNAERLNGMETDITAALEGSATAQASIAAVAAQVSGITGITNDPTYPGLYLLPETSPINPDPDNPGFYTIGA